MTSQINYSAINIAYPVAGQDNNSQGFRDNFAAISAALAKAYTEITLLQTNGLDVTQPTNNLQGTVFTNGLFSQFNGVFYNAGTVGSGGALVNLNNGPIQKVTLSASSTLTFENWPAAGQYSVIRLMLIGNQSGTYTATLSTTNSGVLKTATGWTGGTGTVTVSIGNTGKYEMIEAWTVDGGATVFVKSVGEY
jgi:hypothetical protein